MTTLTKLSHKQAFHNALQVAKQHQLGFAAWKMPHSEEQQCCIGAIEMVDNNRISKSSGFLFHPFDDTASGYFIKSVVHISYSLNQLDYRSENEQLLNEIKKTESSKPKYYTNSDAIALDIDEKEFCDYVSHSVAAIKAEEFQKVVPARSQQVDFTEEFDLFENFNRLCAAYPSAFISVVSIPNIGTWMGATPEVLINVDRHQFQTISLAGTQKHDPALSLSEVSWTQKEIEEQAMVSRYIINCFKKIRLREFIEAGPKTVVAGNLIHLKTTFNVDMKAIETLDLGDQMLDLLHPTSAVCGMPKKEATKFINKYENGNRAFYSGYLGPIQSNDSATLFVNLRCMQLLDKSAILYAGAGVTEDSIPKKEWLETEMKMNTLLNVIKL